MAQPYDKAGAGGRKTLLSQEDLEKIGEGHMDLFWPLEVRLLIQGLINTIVVCEIYADCFSFVLVNAFESTGRNFCILHGIFFCSYFTLFVCFFLKKKNLCNSMQT